MFFESVPKFASPPTSRQLCEMIMNLSPVFQFGDYRVTVHLLAVNNFRPHFPTFEHSHGFYEAIVVLSGEAEHSYNGFRQRVTPGSVLVFQPLEPHAWQTLEIPLQSFTIWFDITPQLPLLSKGRWPARASFVYDIQQLFQDVNAQEEGWVQRTIARLSIILSTILIPAKWDSKQTVEGQDHPYRMVQMIDLFLNDNLRQKVALSDIAAHLSSSIRRITRDYRRITGKSIMQRLLELRMERSAELLSNTDLNLSEICDQVGISDPSYFCRCFRSTFGSSPGKFRKESS